jgi:hypothetical protein
MMIKSLLASAAGAVIAIAVVLGIARNSRVQANYHWSQVEYYRDFINEPSNSGLEPFDVIPSLSSLVALNELSHVDLVFPCTELSDELIRHLNLFFRENHHVVELRYNPTYQDFKVRGEQPLHLKLWFRPAAAVAVRGLMADIENKYSSDIDRGCCSGPVVPD